jgi:hypothetical protein
VEHACFTHACLYVGDDHLLCESRLRQGIHVSSLESRLSAGVALLFRRVPNATLAQREATARIAVGFRGGRYDWRTIAKMWLPLLSRLKREMQDDEAPRRLICSRLCDLAIMRGMRVSILPRDCSPITPADISASDKLDDVAITWRTVHPEPY